MMFLQHQILRILYFIILYIRDHQMGGYERK